MSKSRSEKTSNSPGECQCKPSSVGAWLRYEEDILSEEILLQYEVKIIQIYGVIQVQKVG